MSALTRAYSNFSAGEERDLKGVASKIVTALAILYSLYHIYVLGRGVGLFNLFGHRAIHLLLALSLAFILYSFSKKKQEKISILDIGLALLPLAVLAYVILNLQRITMWISLVNPLTPLDILFGVILILLILEGARRIDGLPLVLVTLVILLYMFYGQFLGGLWWHAGLSFGRVIDVLFLSTEGIWGELMGISSTYIVIFVIFGQLLVHCGGGKFFVDLGNAIAGGGRGGPAKIAVVASALFGTVSGSGVANVATTGSFTIPMMKKMGFKPAFAGAVELTASTGGMITPPVMAATVFLMSEITGIPYWEICVAAIIPAFLYYFTLYWQVHFESIKLGIGRIPREERPRALKVMKEQGEWLVPLAAITVPMMMGYTPVRAALWGIAAILVTGLVRKETRHDLLWRVLKGLESGAKTTLIVVMAIAAGALMVAVITSTGIGGKFGSAVLSLAGGNLFAVLFMSMIASLILGASLSVSATYILTAVLIVPAIMTTGITPMGAHLFAVYFAVLSGVSPPSGAAMFTAAGLAGANPMRVGFNGMKLAVAGFLAPYMFVYDPGLLMMGTPMQIAVATVTAVVALFLMAAAFEGWLAVRAKWWERILMGVGAFMLIFPEGTFLEIGGAAAALGLMSHVLRFRLGKIGVKETVKL